MPQPKARDGGQILVLVGLMAIVLFAIVGLAIDVGRVFVARAELSRDVDAAALAGVLDLPNVSEAVARAEWYVTANDPDATADVANDCGESCLRVRGEKPVDTYFLSVLGIGSVTVSAQAKAGIGNQHLDAVIVLDSTNSMQGTPITEAKKASKDFVSSILGDTPTGYSQVGLTPFRGCFNPPRNQSACVPSSMVLQLTTNKASLISQINGVDAQGGSGTNVCTGLWKASEILAATAQTATNLKKVVILLSDGDNNYTGSVAYQNQTGTANDSPPAACQPTPWDNKSESGGSCSQYDGTKERSLDLATYNMAQTLKASGVEVYVVAFGVCKWTNETSDPCNTGDVGSSSGSHTDNDRDQNLLKCVSSGQEYTYYAASASDLPTIFKAIALQIGHRLIE